MITKTTKGVKVSVETYYQKDQSNPQENRFFFIYKISIRNNGTFPVKLHRRHWDIFDSVNAYRTVEGEGVIGKKPVISPGEVYKYFSGCELQSEIGKMEGYFEMEKWPAGELIKIGIPEFQLISPFKLN